MNDMSPGFLLEEAEPLPGSLNMAIDEWLLSQALRDGWTVLRFYRWSAPTLSLGYFQARRKPTYPAEVENLPRVRRLSGGGAILHDRELTYSFVVPPRHPLASTPVELYRRMHIAIIAGLAEQGISACLRGQEQADRNGAFLCFLRGDQQDVLMGPHKILGSAQRRRKGAILQHGSLLLESSPHAPDVPGIAELTDTPLDPPALIHYLRNATSFLASDWQPLDFTDTTWQAEIKNLEPHYSA